MLLSGIQSQRAVTVKRLVPLMLGALFLAFISSCGRSPSLELDRLVSTDIGKDINLLGNTLSNVVAQLGDPSTVSQADGGNTFFYWPSHGLGVFCHPLFKGQYRHKHRNDWIITSVWVPLKNDLQQRVVKQEDEQPIHFERVLISTNGQEKILAGDRVNLYMNDGALEAFEVQARDCFFDYD